jgi:hypothetical protein
MTIKILNGLNSIRSSLFTLLVLAIAAGASVTSAHAQTVTLEPVGRGHVEVDTFFSNYTPPARASGYPTGVGDAGRKERAFFVYDLPPAPAGMKVVSAKLRIWTGDAGFAIRGGAQTVNFYDVDTAIANLENSTAQFSDFGTGDILASQVYTEADDNGGFKEIQLNDEGLNRLNANLGTKFAFSTRNSEEDRGSTVFVYGGTGGLLSISVADGQTQLILTWGPVAATPPVITTDAPSTIRPNQVPVCFNVNATSASGIANIEVVVIPLKINGAGKVVDKSESAQWTVNGNQVCITDSGGVGTKFFIFALATGNDGAANIEVFEINVVHPRR